MSGGQVLPESRQGFGRFGDDLGSHHTFWIRHATIPDGEEVLIRNGLPLLGLRPSRGRQGCEVGRGSLLGYCAEVGSFSNFICLGASVNLG